MITFQRPSPPCPSCGRPTVTLDVQPTSAIQTAVGGYYPLNRYEDRCTTCYHRWNRRVVRGTFIPVVPARVRRSFFASLRRGLISLFPRGEA